MEVSRMIAEIDDQISKLQQARNLLSGTEPVKRNGPGRPKGSKNATSLAQPSSPGRERKLSPEGRKRIADAMRKRWADRRQTVTKA